MNASVVSLHDVQLDADLREVGGKALRDLPGLREAVCELDRRVKPFGYFDFASSAFAFAMLNG